MQKFSKFYFEKFSFDQKTGIGSFFYNFDNKLFFEEKIHFLSNGYTIVYQFDKKIIDSILFNIFLSLGISYYKLYPTKDLVVCNGFLDDYQIKFWEKFYLNGLGEFFIKNNIDPTNLVNFKSVSNNVFTNKFKSKSKKSLLLLGGGKDSIASYSLIKDREFDLFVFGKLDSIKSDCAKIMAKKPILVKREISSNLFSLNNSGYYNGHVPITGIIAFITQFICYIYHYKYIILSNEKSSSEENIIWKGLKINHQYSKSYEFEKDFSDYTKKYISDDIKYFSILRGMYEYKISEIFSKQKEFFKVFSSCNNNFKILDNKKNVSLWCNKCEKCVFVFLILFPFLGEEEVINIFGKNLFDDLSLRSIFLSLSGVSDHKPFECVGTYEESLFSLYKAIKYYKDKSYKLPIILQNIENQIYNNIEKYDFKKLEEKLLKIYDDDIIPKYFKIKEKKGKEKAF